MSEAHTGTIPFDRDIEEKGSYRYTDGSGFSTRLANARYTEMILSCVDFRGKSVVDMGSGDGTYTAELVRGSGAASVLGVEPSPRAVERACSAYRGAYPHLEFLCGDSETLLQKDQRFDVAVYRGVIHHVTDPRTEIRRAMTLGKTVIILEPNGLNPLMKLVERASPYHRQHGERSFAPRTLSRWIREGEGRVQQVRFFGLVPYFCPAFIGRLGRRLEPLVESGPLLRALCCGQYILVASRSSSS